MPNTSSARSFQEAQAAVAILDQMGADDETFRYLYTGKDRDTAILAKQEEPLPTWYPTGRTWKGMAI
jgi:hypothetical protein